MSILAFRALRVSLIRMGSAWALISWSRPSLFGYSMTETLVTLPFVTVSRTWTGPYLVCAAAPVTVFAADDAVDAGCVLEAVPVGGEPALLAELVERVGLVEALDVLEPVDPLMATVAPVAACEDSEVR